MSDDYLNKPLSMGVGGESASVQLNQQSTINATHLSPYLNYDPRYLKQAQPEFIFPEGASKQRGRFELAFSQIGTSVMIGAGVGGVAGLYNGIRTTSSLEQTGKLRRTQLLNHVMKQGSATANTLGTVAVMYAIFGTLLQWSRGEDDHVNTVIAGTATGLLYKSSAGLKKCAIGGGVGLGLTAMYCIFQLTQNGSKKFDMKSFM